jgi:glycosyltransferase involved in cell wall biosynthesis
VKKQMQKIKVANIIEEGRLGGPQVRMVEVAAHLKGMCVDNTVICPFLHSYRFKKRLMDNNIKFVQLPLQKLTRKKWELCSYLFSFVFELAILIRYFKKEKFDVIHVSGGWWQFKGLIAGKLAGSKVLWHLNDTNAPLLFRFFVKIVCHLFVDGLIVAGKKVRHYYLTGMGISGKPVFEIQAPVNTRYFNPVEVKKDTQKILSLTGFNIVSVGNINPTKGYEFFIQTAKLLKDIKDVHFYIIGPHFETQKAYSDKLFQLKAMLGTDNLEFLGPSDNIREILYETDIYICSSQTEASPLSVWEAMSMEIPVISTNVGDVPCLIRDGENGFIVPCQCPEKMAQNVRILLGDKTLRQTFGKKARQAVIEKLDIAIVIQQHMAAYAYITGKRI